MASLLVNGVRYEQLPSGSLQETEYEAILLARARDVFPGYTCCTLKHPVSSEDGTACPDLALIETEFREWWVVEVELAHHSFAGHVLPQARTLAGAVYGQEVLARLLSQAPAVDSDRLRDVVLATQPRTLVVVNESKPDWALSLKPYGVELAVVEVFRSEASAHVLRLNGVQPRCASGLVSKCRFDRQVPRLLSISSPGGLDVQPNATIEIRFRGRLTSWSRIDSADRVWLLSRSPEALPWRRSYDLVRLADGTLEFR